MPSELPYPVSQSGLSIVVLGGSGFIGSRLVGQLLAAGHRVRIFDKAPSAAFPELVIPGDVRDADAVARALQGCDCAINLAAEHRDDVTPASLYFDVNVRGAENVARGAAANGVRHLVFLSTVAVYGLDQPMADESAALKPFNDYGVSKAQAEAVYAAWAGGGERRALTLIRSTVVFGEGNRGNVFNLIEQIRQRRFLMIGSGSNHKSIAYVGNLVDFICSALDAGPGIRVFNYADKPDLTTRELVQEICALLPGARHSGLRLPYGVALAAGYAFDALAWLTGRKLAISSTRVRKFCAETRVATPALERSGFCGRYSIKEGLARMVAGIEAAPRPERRE